jgi:hypothetical protein
VRNISKQVYRNGIMKYLVEAGRDYYNGPCYGGQENLNKTQYSNGEAKTV